MTRSSPGLTSTSIFDLSRLYFPFRTSVPHRADRDREGSGRACLPPPPATEHTTPASTASVAASAAPPHDPPCTRDIDAGHHSPRPHERSSTTLVPTAARSPGTTHRPPDPRDLLPLGQRQPQRDRTGSRAGGRRITPQMLRHDAVPAPDLLRNQPRRRTLRRQLRDPPPLQLRQPLRHNTPPDRSNSIERRDALTP